MKTSDKKPAVPIEAAKENNDRLNDTWRSLLNAYKSGIFLIDARYHLILVNEYGKRLLEAIDSAPAVREAAYFPDKLPAGRQEAVKKSLAIALQGERLDYEIPYTKTDGTDLWLQVEYTPVKDDDGAISAVCIMVTNISALKKKEAALIKSEQRWKFALDGAGDGVWEYNFLTNESYYSIIYKNMLGYSDEEFPNEDYEWRTRIHPEDLPRIGDIDRQYHQGLIDHHAVEYRIRHKSGSYAWVLDRGMVLERTPEGNPLKLIGTHTNITERRMTEETLSQSEQRFSSFMANTPTLNWIIDENAIFRYLNESYLKAFNLTENDIGRSIYEIFPKNICDSFVENNWMVWNSGHPIETTEKNIAPSGEILYYQIFKFPLTAQNGLRLLGGVALDITKKIQLEKLMTEEESKKKREIIQAIINAQEKERKELAYELHDNVNQVLTSSKLMLEVAVEKPELSAEFVKRSLNYLNEAIIEIRKISHSLTPGTLQDISLEAAIGEVVQAINATGKLRIIYNNKTVGIKKEVQADIQLSALRIVQEQLNNILKHAGATEALVSLELNEQQLLLSVSDNGRGFHPAETKRGLGLNNIFNRVEYYHGKIRLDSMPGNGCSLLIEIPLP